MKVKVAQSSVIDYFKEMTNGINLSTKAKELLLTYLEEVVTMELQEISEITKELMDIQNKRTLQERDWKFILKYIKNE
ncbi:MAG: hypothetical protein U9O98_09820 [Asgard group archaeon]|nr:hypothetical protein [Asgard group archaeon]